MSKPHYEDFLVKRFCLWAAENLRIGERIHFRSPDDANSLLLHRAFVRQAQDELLVQTETGVQSLPYLKVAQYHVLPVLHAERGVGFTDNYISTLRDMVSAQQGQLKNSVLLVIHNSALDTLNNSSRNLCLTEHDVWNPAVIRDQLKEMIEPYAPDRSISEALLDHQFNAILAEGATMFSFRELFNAVRDGRIEFKELHLLNDPAIGGWDNAEAIEKRLAENKKLKDQIEHLVEQYPSELHEKLKELDFSENFIKQHFPEGDLEGWRSTLDYGQCKQEQQNNSENLLELESESVQFGHKAYPGSKAETGAGARERYFIIEIPASDNRFQLNLSFVNGLIKDEEVKLKAAGITATVNRRSNKRHVLEVVGDFKGSPTFFSLDLKRAKPKENFRYRVLLLPADAFYVAGFATGFVLKPAQKKIILQTDSTTLQLAADDNPTVVMSENGQEFDVQSAGSIDYEQVVNATDRLSFNIRSGEHVLQFDVEGAVSSATLALPLLLDKSLHTRLFHDDFYGVFNPINGKVALDGKELKPRTEHRKLLLAEANLLQQQLLSDAIGMRPAIHLDALQQCYPELYQDYTELFAWLTSKRTLLSLASWGNELAAIVERLVQHYVSALHQIPTARLLTADEQLLVNIGFARIEEEEYLTPYHPLNLAYFSSLRNALQGDETQSFKTLPAATVNRLNAEGLLPFNWHSHHDFSYSQVVKENPMWLAVVPAKQTQLDYIQRLVRDKTKEFVGAFSTLFASGEKDTLLINSINNGLNKEVLLGLVAYFKQRKPEQAHRIHINLYDAELQHTYFDKVADAETFDQIKQLCGLTADKDDADAAVDMIRRRITYSKFSLPQSGAGFRYAHLSFVRNNTPVMKSPVSIMDEKSGIACHGLLAGETSYSEEKAYFTTSGLQNIEVAEAPQLQVMQKYSALSKAVWLGEKYNDSSSLALKVSNQLQQLLDAVYEDSIWTVIIDPKVTLDFFKSQKDVVLIHYSDNYTNSANYDAITVTKRRDFYDQILAQGTKGLIDEFNAFNGEWLLKMLTLPDNERREKKSIIGAYKFIHCLLYHSDITWVPLSVAEMLRVAGNIGLKMSDADFSRHSQGIREGVISDDVLFVGFKAQQMYLLPLEVKVGKKQKHDKGVRQAKELKRYLVEQLFGRTDLAGHLYRGLFIRQIFMQVDKYELYRVYANDYFTQLKEQREWWLQGDYTLADIAGYPQGFVLAFIEGEYSSEQYQLEHNILQLKLPSGYQAKFVSTPMQTLLDDCSSQALGFIDEAFILKGETTAVAIEHSVMTASSDEDAAEASQPIQAENDSDQSSAALFELEPTVFRKVAHSGPDYPAQATTLADCRVLIGHSPKTGEAIYWEYGHKDLANRHLIIFGNSGQGKTYCIQGLLMELAKYAINSMVVDYTNGFLPEHLEPEFISSVKPQTDLVADKPLRLNPFKKQKNIVAGTELSDKAYDVASRVASVFKSVYSSIGDQQLPTLIRVIEEGLGTYGEQYSFKHMLQALEDYDQTGVKVANKLLPLVKANIFAFEETNGWDDIYQSEDSVCRLIQMARLSRDVWLAAVEFILWDLYSYACLHGDKNSPLPIVLDEVQNLDHRLESPLGKMLTEGRKYGLSLILATQTMSNLGKDEQDRLFQASHKLFFAPAMTEVQTYAKLLEQAVPGSDKKYWLSELSKLKKGECISVGMHQNIDGRLLFSAKALKVSGLRERF